MSLNAGREPSRLTVHALLTFAALVLEVPLLFIVLVVWTGAASTFDPGGPATATRPGVEWVCGILFVAVPSIMLVLAVWRRFWVLTAVQVGILLFTGYEALGSR